MFRHLFLTDKNITALCKLPSQYEWWMLWMSEADNEDFENLVDVNLLGKDCDGPQILRLVSPMRKMSKEKNCYY